MRRYKIEYAPDFGHNLVNIYDYIYDVLENPSGADNVINKIRRKCQSLSVFPNGNPVKIVVLGKGLRFAHIDNYTIVYYVDNENDRVIINYVFYSRRDIERFLEESIGD